MLLRWLAASPAQSGKASAWCLSVCLSLPWSIGHTPPRHGQRTFRPVIRGPIHLLCSIVFVDADSGELWARIASMQCVDTGFCYRRRSGLCGSMSGTTVNHANRLNLAYPRCRLDRQHANVMVKGKSSSYSIVEPRVPELIPVLCSQPAGDMSHKPGGRLPLLSARPAVTLTTLKRAATSFAAR